MTLILWIVLAIAVLLSVFLVYMEHEWGFILGGATAFILIISYFLAGLVTRSALVGILPHAADSHLDVMAIIAVALFVVALIVIAYLMGRRSSSKTNR